MRDIGSDQSTPDYQCYYFFSTDADSGRSKLLALLMTVARQADPYLLCAPRSQLRRPAKHCAVVYLAYDIEVSSDIPLWVAIVDRWLDLCRN